MLTRMTEIEVIDYILKDKSLGPRNHKICLWLDEGNKLNHSRWSEVRETSYQILVKKIESSDQYEYNLEQLNEALNMRLFKEHRGYIGYFFFQDTTTVGKIRTLIVEQHSKLQAENDNAIESDHDDQSEESDAEKAWKKSEREDSDWWGYGRSR